MLDYHFQSVNLIHSGTDFDIDILNVAVNLVNKTRAALFYSWCLFDHNIFPTRNNFLWWPEWWSLSTSYYKLIWLFFLLKTRQKNVLVILFAWYRHNNKNATHWFVFAQRSNNTDGATLTQQWHLLLRCGRQASYLLYWNLYQGKT